jgi:subtilisin family serine protease
MGLVKGHILVQPRPGLPDAEFAKALAPHGGYVVGQITNLGVYVVALPAAASEAAVANLLSRNPHIKFAEPDAVVEPVFAPSDPYYGNEWHLFTIGASSAWDRSLGTGVTVAILDSGIDATHPDFQGQLVSGWNFYDNNSSTADVYGHGTEVAGVIGAIGNNGIGVAGVAWGAKLMPIRVTDTSGNGYISMLASGLTYAADHGARVANMSFAVQSYSTIQTAAQYLRNKGGVACNSAGNYGTLDSTPPTDSLVSVSATDSTDTLASWSSYGPYVDVSAPGVGIWTTTLGGGYAAPSGTSFSSPLTCGVIALMMAANPALAPSQIVGLLESTAVDLGTPGYDYYYGYGRINAAAAVLAAAQATGADTQPPVVSISSPTGGTVSGIVPVNVSASDNVGVTRVDLLVNGTLLASDTTTPYGFSWDSTGLGGGATLVARAYDAAGNSGTSQTVTVTVGAAPPVTPDTIPPTVTISKPSNGSTVKGVIAIAATATDNVGVASFSLYVDGTVKVTGNVASISYQWNTRKAASGAHTISAVAKDAAGNQTTATINVIK